MNSYTWKPKVWWPKCTCVTVQGFGVRGRMLDDNRIGMAKRVAESSQSKGDQIRNHNGQQLREQPSEQN